MNPQVLRPAEVNRLLRTPDGRSARGRRDAALVGLLVCAGLRLHEASSLRRQDLIGKRLTFAGKGGRVRTVTIPTKALRLLRRQLKEHGAEYVFPGRYGESLSVKQAYNVVKAVCRSAGLGDWVHPHSLRHTCASTIMRETSDLFLTQRMLGHASPDTTARYYLAHSSADADRAADAIERSLSRRRELVEA